MTSVNTLAPYLKHFSIYFLLTHTHTHTRRHPTQRHCLIPATHGVIIPTSDSIFSSRFKVYSTYFTIKQTCVGTLSWTDVELLHCQCQLNQIMLWCHIYIIHYNVQSRIKNATLSSPLKSFGEGLVWQSAVSLGSLDTMGSV